MPETNSDYLSTGEASEISGLSIRQISRLFDADRIPGAIWCGKRRLIPRKWAESSPRQKHSGAPAKQ